MPCRYDPSPEEIAASRKAAEEKLTAPLRATKRELEDQVETLELKNAALSARVDELTEVILELDANTSHPGSDWIDELRERQIKHRKADLDRLLTCGKITDAELVRKVATADPNHPLLPQLGFDPDIY